jgi:hypothetical protein
MHKRSVLAAVAVIAAAFVVLGGPAAATHFINGGSIKPGTVGGKQIANGAISSSKLSKSLRKAIGKTGPKGATGATGAAGATGSRGPAGAFDVVDAQGRTIGLYAGTYSSYLEVYTAAGALLMYDPSLTTTYPLPLGGAAIFYQQANCAGAAYAPYNGTPMPAAIILDSPPSAGSQIYSMQGTGSPTSFSYQSVKTSSGCTNSSSTVSQAFPVTSAGTVPAVQKPLSIVPAG